MTLKVQKVKVKGESAVGKIRQLSLALRIPEEEVVQQAVELFWVNRADKVREFLASIDNGTALFANNGSEGKNDFDLES